MTLSCIIVEDREDDRELLQSYIADEARLMLLAHFNNTTDAREYLRENEVNLIFCDIMVGESDGLSFIRSLESRHQVIFTTSFPNFAVTGFELDATDYLVKPYIYKRFSQAVQKAIEKNGAITLEQPLPEKTTGADGHFFIRSEHSIIRINYKDVVYVEGLKDYVKIITNDKTYMSAIHLKVMEDQLPEDRFIRVHRSYIVNIHKIESLNNFEIMAGGKSLPLGETYRENFLKTVVNKKIIKK